MKFAVIGIGGVGGFVGGLLAKAGVDTAFVARGAHLEAIKANGLQVKSDVLGDFVAVPRIATYDTTQIGIVDCIIVATKSYSFADIPALAAPMAGPDTIIIPLENGVGSAQKLKELGCPGQVADGCVYIVTKITAPGCIEISGIANRVVFGDASGKISAQRLDEIAAVLQSAGVKAEHSKKIDQEIWEKFVFINCVGCTQSYFDVDADGLRSDPAKLTFFRGMLDETCAVGRALGIELPVNLADSLLELHSKMAGSTRSSLQRDLAAGGKTELDSLCVEVCRLADKLDILVPYNQLCVQKLLK